MAEYITKEATIEAVETTSIELFNSEWKELEREVKALPAADVVPVVRAKWAHIGGDEFCCTNCGFVISTEGSWEKPTQKYCENCGAKMDVGESYV